MTPLEMLKESLEVNSRYARLVYEYERVKIMEQKPMKCPKCSKELNVNNTCNETDCYIGCKKPMTREEALYKGQMGGMSVQVTQSLITTLEALGLLKFDEVDVNRDIHRCGITLDNLRALDKAGYKIVRDDEKAGAVARLIAACRRFVKSRDTMDEASAIKCIETYTKELD